MIIKSGKEAENINALYENIEASGHNDGYRGRLKDNPYQEGTWQHDAYQRGFMSGLRQYANEIDRKRFPWTYN
ncbi:hypothetical protein [Enterovibrio paralichthyis]|uniref:hypothetical protein n=1 Tax=Enterovibrio paralichthyis TaxID=2853805 RepID=UPI001C4917B1|nr:hypothetical protein [Enterovibrio paralichthyis]MBV7300737.1 hypothetical protein [Enterovibrio paralichthyis]